MAALQVGPPWLALGPPGRVDPLPLTPSAYDGIAAVVPLRGATEPATPVTPVTVARHMDKIIQARWSPAAPLFVTTSADRSAALWTLA